MDSYKTPLGDIRIEVIGHASLHMEWNGKQIYSDPYSEVSDFKGMPSADLVLITHNHYDHYDLKALENILTPESLLIVSQDVGKRDDRYTVLKNGDTTTYEGMTVRAVPAYNINRRNEQGELFHPKGVGNGYILNFGGYKVYIAGDTEQVPEMKRISGIEIAFLPKNLPYTMTDEEFVKLANLIKPKYLYPIHFFELDVAGLVRHLDTGITMMNKN